jgi:hypothetical protein
MRAVLSFVEDLPDASSGGVTRRAVVVAVVQGKRTAQEDAELEAVVSDLVAEPVDSGEDVRTAAGGLAPGDDLHVGGMRIALLDAPWTDEALVITWRTGQVVMPALPSLTALLTSRG